MSAEFPQKLKNAMGELIIHTLAQGGDVDQGMWFSMDNITMGDPKDGIPLGDWKITIQRTKKP